MERFETEQGEQPEALATLLRTGRDDVRRVAAEVLRFDPAFAVIAARGSSANAGRYAQYLFGLHNHLAVAHASPSLLTRYDARFSLARALVIGVSQSGRFSDVVSVVREVTAQGA